MSTTSTRQSPTLADRVAKQGHRALWHINRSPLAHVVKWGVRMRSGSEVRERRALAAALPRAPSLDACAKALRDDGYVRLDDIVDRAALEALGAAGDRKLERTDTATAAQSHTHKKFWARLLDEDMQDGVLPTDNPFVAYALQAPVIGVLARCFGEIPRLDYVLLTLSRYSGDSFEYSQLWHLDYDDVNTVKLFAYLTDVNDEDDGPFTFLPGPISDRFGFSIKSHRPDARILERARPEEIRRMTAPRLSTFMVETSRCLHMGSRVRPGHQRLLYTATFTTAPRMYPEPPPRFRLTGRESALERKVLARAA